MNRKVKTESTVCLGTRRDDPRQPVAECQDCELAARGQWQLGIQMRGTDHINLVGGKVS